MMIDTIETYAGCELQHGKHNDRVYLMRFGGDDPAAVLARIQDLCTEHGYSKSFAKVPARFAPAFLASGYRIEGYVPEFYAGSDDGLFLALYLDESRLQIPADEMAALASILEHKPGETGSLPETPASYELCRMEADDTEEMAEVLGTVFTSYPFPVDDPAFLKEQLAGETLAVGIRDQGRLIGVASAEMNTEAGHAEMTDFAVLPEYRGQKLALLMLHAMEEGVQEYGIRTAYTIARLRSPGMNATFLKAGYWYSGTLFSNTNISGGLESMNIWYKGLQ
jgi:beta-lysine N6-acetyltransferase